MKTSDAKSARRRKTAGVVHSGDGSVVYAGLKMKRGRWVVEGVDSWPLSNALKTALRLSGGAALGIRAEWRRGASDSALELPASGANADINPYLHPAGAEFLLDALSGSVTSLAAEDSFLLTLPLAFCTVPAASFLSIYSEGNIVTLGVVIEKRLEAVFSFPCDAASHTQASVARVRRYWGRVLKRDDFPKKAFVWGTDGQDGCCDGLDTEPLALPEELNGGGAMRAAGAALAAFYSPPVFKLPPQHGFRARRPLLLKFSAVLFCLSLMITLASFVLNAQANAKLAESEKIYNSRLGENKALRDLNSTAKELSANIFSIKNAYARSTNWGNFLLLLSEIKPDGLFPERLGADNVQGSENSVRIALGGWSLTETSVTELISGLQASGFIDDVSLSSIERDAKNKNICRFRILCTMRLFKD